MATTFTVSEVAPGDTIYTYASLVRSDTCAAINVTSVKRIVVQVMSGNVGTDNLVVEGSLDGSTWGPIYPPDAVSLSGIAAVAVGFTGDFSSSASGQLAVQPTYLIRVRVASNGATPAASVKFCILLRSL